jgi:hypothetical protein
VPFYIKPQVNAWGFIFGLNFCHDVLSNYQTSEATLTMRYCEK